MRKTEKGVTLVELLVVMVVLAILAAIAVPSYRRYVVRAQRTDATTALLRLQSAQEKFFLQKGVYTENLTDPQSGTPGGLGLVSSNTEQGYYSLDVDLTATGYTATARPIATAGQKDDSRCVEFSVDETGRKKAKDSGNTDRTTECWR
jgi:type IV pilus assembly protein PilE